MGHFNLSAIQENKEKSPDQGDRGDFFLTFSIMRIPGIRNLKTGVSRLPAAAEAG